jgi:hypothetical protein
VDDVDGFHDFLKHDPFAVDLIPFHTSRSYSPSCRTTISWCINAEVSRDKKEMLLIVSDL